MLVNSRIYQPEFSAAGITRLGSTEMVNQAMLQIQGLVCGAALTMLFGVTTSGSVSVPLLAQAPKLRIMGAGSSSSKPAYGSVVDVAIECAQANTSRVVG